MPVRDPYNFDYSKKKATYFVGVGVSVIKVGYSEVTERKVLKLPENSLFPEEKRTSVPFGKYKGEWYEIMGGKRDKQTNEPTDVYLRVNKNEIPKGYPNTFPKSLPYFILPADIEPKYGVRATEISIVLLGSNSEQILPADYIKFEGGQLRCIGNGETANRFNPLTGVFEEDLPICQCAFSRTFERDKKEKIATEVNYDDAPQDRTVNGKRQVLVQNAWRDVAKWDDDLKIVELVPYKDNKPPCELHARLRFIIPELGMEVCEFEFRGKQYYSEVKAEIDLLIWQLAIYGIQIYQVPLILKVEMQTKNTAGKGTRNFPKISLRFRDPIENIVENLASKALGTGTKPPEQKQLAQTNPAVTEDAEFIMVDEDFEEDDDIATIEEKYGEKGEPARDEHELREEQEYAVKNKGKKLSEPTPNDDELKNKVSEEIQNSIKDNLDNPEENESIGELKKLVDQKHGEGYADKQLKDSLITGKTISERNKNTIDFLKSLL